MVILKKIDEVRAQVKEWKKQGLTVGLVPTMGYLHEGHQSLIKKSVEQNDRTVVSVFVNPIQFGPNEDLESYPRDLEADAKLCESTGADIIFNPEPEEMYADGFVIHQHDRTSKCTLRTYTSNTFQGCMYSCRKALQYSYT